LQQTTKAGGFYFKYKLSQDLPEPIFNFFRKNKINSNNILLGTTRQLTKIMNAMHILSGRAAD
jgi:hypothetical protein